MSLMFHMFHFKDIPLLHEVAMELKRHVNQLKQREHGHVLPQKEIFSVEPKKRIHKTHSSGSSSNEASSSEVDGEDLVSKSKSEKCYMLVKLLIFCKD